MGTFLYPRTVTITRPGAQSGEGQQGYGGLSPTTEAPVTIGAVSSWNASIQAAGTRNNPTGTPSDVPISCFRVFIFGFPDGVVQDRDIITDEKGRRYQVISSYCDSLGSNFYCMRLEV